MAGNGRNPGESVADKIFAVLDAFCAERSELTAAQLSRLTGVPQSTMSRLLRSLVEWGGLERSADGTYRVATKLWQISTRYRVAGVLRSAALPIMRDLSVACPGQVGLCAVEGCEGVIVEQLANPAVGRVLGSPGGRIPLHASALGKVLLAFSPPSLLEDFASRPLARFTPKTLTSSEALRREMCQVRMQRYAVCKNELVPGQLGVAVPVFGAQSDRVVSFGIVVEDGVAGVGELLTALRAAAEQLGRAWQTLPLEPPRSITPDMVRRSASPPYCAPARVSNPLVGTGASPAPSLRS